MTDYPPTVYLEEIGNHEVTIKAAKMKYGDDAKPPWADTSVLIVAETDDGKTAFVNLEISPLKFKSGDRPEWLVSKLNENLSALGIDAEFSTTDYDPDAAIVELNEKAEQAVGNRSVLKLKLNQNGYTDYKFVANLGKAKANVSVDEVADAFGATEVEAEVF